MADNTSIEWADATWNPIAGCSLVSPGCTNCYAMRHAARMERILPSDSHYAGLTKPSKAGPVWTGRVNLAPEHIMTKPLTWRKPKRIFVNSMSDLFHESIPDAWIDRVFAVMALASWHQFLLLTKRQERMRAYCSDPQTPVRIARLILDMAYAGHIKGDLAVRPLGNRQHEDDPEFVVWPLPNVWKGVSVEDQPRADERIPILLDTPARVRWISAEPILGPVDVRPWLSGSYECASQCGWRSGDAPSREYCHACGITSEIFEEFCSACGAQDFGHICPHCESTAVQGHPDTPCLDWIVAGGESGPGARPMHPDWARSLRDQCEAAGVPFLFKQWGEWIDFRQFGASSWRNKTPQRAGYRGPCIGTFHGGEQYFSGPFQTLHRGSFILAKRGKRAAGRLLDGIQHDAFPEVTR
jgi:protein gp37